MLSFGRSALHSASLYQSCLLLHFGSLVPYFNRLVESYLRLSRSSTWPRTRTGRRGCCPSGDYAGLLAARSRLFAVAYDWTAARPWLIHRPRFRLQHPRLRLQHPHLQARPGGCNAASTASGAKRCLRSMPRWSAGSVIAVYGELLGARPVVGRGAWSAMSDRSVRIQVRTVSLKVRARGIIQKASE